MDLLQVLCVCLLSVLSTCSGKTVGHASSIFFTDEDPAEQIPVCRYQNKPCMIMVRDFHSNGTLRGAFRSRNMCQCGAGITCPSTWDGNPDRTITRYLRTRGSVMTLQMNFCRPVQTERVCEPNEVALTLQGVSIVTLEVTSVNCRCPTNDPMYKRKVWYEMAARSIRNENYVCSMPDCASGRDAPCLLYYRGDTRRETTFLCKCPGVMQCRTDTLPSRGQDHTIGRCTSAN